jgi:LuxR family maltose regulon positive regulatory protein
MPDHLVTTKLLVPRPRARAVARRRLDELLGRGSDATLTLVSAPAGFGKTTMLAAWLAAGGPGRSAAWVSLDERDRDPSSFWTYVLLAVDRAAPGTATAALAQLQSGQTPIDVVLTALLNELSVRSEDITLVLDDYHLAEGPDIQPGMVFLLEHLPPQVHVVISTRADPALPLARLRARGELVEVRVGDLRFTEIEATTYFNDVNALDLDLADVATLERRTEGWAAALQLVALSLRGRDDAAAFIAGFAGDDRFVVDYLADEVLDRQPPSVRQFLLDTSTLDRLTAGLCDAVTGRTDGREMLESLERQNLFVIALDDNRRWYRYHHLFADVLHARLLDERPGDEPELHRRASDWYDRAGDPEASVRHALAAGDVGLAAARAELAVPGLNRERRESVIRRWIDDFPADIVKNRPVLAVGFIGALSRINEFDSLPRRLLDVERLLAGPAEDLVVVDHAELLRLPAAVETYRAALALVAGDLTGTVEHADLALARAPQDDDLTTASASALVGLASWAGGDLHEAHRAYRVAAESLTRAGHIADVLGCTIAVTDIELTQGNLGQAQQSGEHALDLAAQESPQPRGVADMYVVLSRVALERRDIARAADHLRRADELGDLGGLPQNPYRWRVAMALLREIEGDVAAAVELLEEAERVYVGDFSPNVQPIAATRARVLAAAGEVAGALAWARGRGLSASDDLSYAREYEHLSLAHVLYADHVHSGRATSLADAAALLDRLVWAAEAGGRLGVVIEGLVLQALVREAAGEREQALDALERALRLAEPHGYVRVFTVEATRMRDLLRAVGGRHPQWEFVTQLLDVMASPTRAPAEPPPSSAAGSPGGPAVGSLIEPLSRRELVVLRYLGTDLDGPAIARELGVSLSTVRTHTQHIYVKLGVTNRRAAVGRAHQLNLSERPPRH